MLHKIASALPVMLARLFVWVLILGTVALTAGIAVYVLYWGLFIST